MPTRADLPTDVRWYYEQIKQYPILSREEERRLVCQMRRGDPKARRRLIESNLRFVVSVARSYYNGFVPLEDLISAGNEGLVRALDRYDHRRGFKFITYAVYWIRVGIRERLALEARSVRMPMHFYYYLTVVIKTRDKLYLDLERLPTVEELVKHSGVSRFYVEKTLALAQRDDLLDGTFFGSDEPLIESYVDPNESVADVFEQTALAQAVTRSLSVLDDRQRFILIHYFGLFGVEPQKLETIGQRIGITRERVRQIKVEALAKLGKQKPLKALVA